MKSKSTQKKKTCKVTMGKRCLIFQVRAVIFH